MMIGAIPTIVTLVLSMSVQADWAMLRGDPQHTGFVQATVHPPFRLVWVRHFIGERMGSAFEPVVADGKIFVTTHNDNLYALNAQSGQPLWRFQANGAFLHSPAFSDGIVVAGNTDGRLYGLDGETGELRWSIAVNQGGFAASPVTADGRVFIGSRAGEFLAADVLSGRLQWRHHFDVPIRQTAAFAHGRVFVTAEDLRVRCMDAQTGQVLWISQQLVGQTARDYYPVIANAGSRAFVIVRTNPVLHMANLIGQDRRLLTQQAGLGDAGWREMDAWTKSEQARGSQELWAEEQDAIIQYLTEHPGARSFFVLDAETGEEAMTAPMLWIGGCQGVGTPPVLLPTGQLLVFYRSAYGNWNHGVAPLVALGILDLAQNRIAPLSHDHGMSPPWNTFWGTADESQNFLVADDTVLLIHQGTLSAYDLKTKRLSLIWGNRDTWGAFHNLPHARNEWHGPARGGVAVIRNRIYWQTGSRILCIATGEEGEPGADVGIQGNGLATQHAPEPSILHGEALRQNLVNAVTELLSQRWAPLYVEPGLAAREFFFDDSGEVFEALAWAYPHLPMSLQGQVKAFLADEWEEHPPFTHAAWYALNEGERRERFWVPPDVLSRWHADRLPHPFSNLYAVWLYAERCGEWERVLAQWPKMRTSYEGFVRTGWRLGPNEGRSLANRYLASLLAMARIAEKKGDREIAQSAHAVMDEAGRALIAWWQRSADSVSMPIFQNISEWDAFLGKGDFLFFKAGHHRAKLALFHDITPQVANMVKAQASEAVDKSWSWLEVLCPTWHLAGEERQVHYGENFVDPPDFALDAFRAMAWLKDAPSEELVQRIDIPCCRADPSYITKLAIALSTFNSKNHRCGDSSRSSSSNEVKGSRLTALSSLLRITSLRPSSLWQ